jgi:hypothetical protein
VGPDVTVAAQRAQPMMPRMTTGTRPTEQDFPRGRWDAIGDCRNSDAGAFAVRAPLVVHG